MISNPRLKRSFYRYRLYKRFEKPANYNIMVQIFRPICSLMDPKLVSLIVLPPVELQRRVSQSRFNDFVKIVEPSFVDDSVDKVSIVLRAPTFTFAVSLWKYFLNSG